MKYAGTLKKAASALLLTLPMCFGAQAAKAEEVTISHYFTGDLGLTAMQAFFDCFQKETGISVKDSGIGHEDYKTAILVRAAANACRTCSAMARAHGRNSSWTPAVSPPSTTSGHLQISTRS
jgi:ABC-type glycerol-3-phosphate transport system substrate-binding protein